MRQLKACQNLSNYAFSKCIVVYYSVFFLLLFFGCSIHFKSLQSLRHLIWHRPPSKSLQTRILSCNTLKSFETCGRFGLRRSRFKSRWLSSSHNSHDPCLANPAAESFQPQTYWEVRKPTSWTTLTAVVGADAGEATTKTSTGDLLAVRGPGQ